MSSLCGLICIFDVKNAPTLCMTATATEVKLKEMKESLGLKDDQIVVLKASPVQSNVKFQTLRRPPNGIDFEGECLSSGTFRPGLGNLKGSSVTSSVVCHPRKQLYSSELKLS